MDKIKRIITAHVPIDKCNFRCRYCYISQRPEGGYSPNKFKYSAGQIRKALSKERMGGPCYINLCGDGETLIPIEIIDITRELLEEGHFVEIVTNGSLTTRINQLLEFPSDLRKHLAFKVSFHYEELVRLGLLDTLFDNFNKMLDSGCSAYLEMVATDSLIPHQKEIYDLCVEKAGAPCHLTIERDDQTPEIRVKSRYDLPEYEYMWKDFDCEMMRFKAETFYKKRTEFCYAGDWSLYVSIGDGAATQCYNGHASFNIFDNPEERLPLFAIGSHCNCAHCYNSHAFLTWGTIPEIITPTYAQMRDRVRTDGRHWLNSEAREFFSRKLIESNTEYDLREKKLINAKNYIYKHKAQNSAVRLAKLALYTAMQKAKALQKEHKRRKNNELRLKLIESEVELKRKNGAIYWMLNTPTHGNLGDHAIVYAQHRFLERIGKNNVIEIGEMDFDLFKDQIRTLVSPEDVILIDGGGNLGTLWLEEHQKIENIVNSYKENKIVVFPQTVFYSENSYGLRYLNISKETFDAHDKLAVFLRDRKSFDFFSSNFNTACALVPDIVLSLNSVVKSQNRNGVLLCIRKDRERQLSIAQEEEIKKLVRELEESVGEVSTVVDYSVDKYNRKASLEEIWHKFAGTKLVITDRLHGMIFCAITNTPCIALDNLSNKVRGAYEWLSRCNYIRFIDGEVTIDDITEMIKVEVKNYVPVIEDFSPLKNELIENVAKEIST